MTLYGPYGLTHYGYLFINGRHPRPFPFFLLFRLLALSWLCNQSQQCKLPRLLLIFLVLSKKKNSLPDELQGMILWPSGFGKGVSQSHFLTRNSSCLAFSCLSDTMRIKMSRLRLVAIGILLKVFAIHSITSQQINRLNQVRLRLTFHYFPSLESWNCFPLTGSLREEIVWNRRSGYKAIAMAP